jgi:hypothetical protein
LGAAFSFFSFSGLLLFEAAGALLAAAAEAPEVAQALDKRQQPENKFAAYSRTCNEVARCIGRGRIAA